MANQNYIHLYVPSLDPIKVCVQNGVSGSYMDAVLKLWHTNSQKSGQISYTVFPIKAYYSCQVSRVCRASI